MSLIISGMTMAVRAVLAMALLNLADSYTLPDQVAAALQFKDEMSLVGPHWKYALRTWTCPTPANATASNESCDPCGVNVWYGHFDHAGCRGRTTQDHDILGGDGYITNLHVTDLNIEGPVPEQTCAFKWLKELDLDGGNLTGTIPQFLSTCFPMVNEIDLSYNHLTGTLPTFLANISSLTELELESNELTGTIPPELSTLPNVTSLRFENNNFHGLVPQSFSDLSDTLFILFLYNNNFTGDLSMVSGANLGVVSTSHNPLLCGMVPASVRWAHGYNPLNTSLGQPCPAA